MAHTGLGASVVELLSPEEVVGECVEEDLASLSEVWRSTSGIDDDDDGV